MLYITTRSDKDTFTSHRALCADTAADGGHFTPFRLPKLSAQEVMALKDKSFNQIVAEVLNLFFSAGLSGWDVDFLVGKCPLEIRSMNHRIFISELWHNPGGGLNAITQQLFMRLCAGNSAAESAGSWARTAVRIATLFGIYGQLACQGHIASGEAVDIVVPADDFLMPMAARYARSMSLPIRMVICACDESSNVWELIHKGTFATAGVSASLLLGVEHLVSICLGIEEANRFVQICKQKKTYSLTEESAAVLSDGFFCAVASEGRASATINSVYRSNAYIADPQTALCFSALQDYRSATGTGRATLILAEDTPLEHQDVIMKATGISAADLAAHINR